MKHEFSWVTPAYSAQVIVWIENGDIEYLDSYDKEGVEPDYFEDLVVEYALDWYNSNTWHQFNRPYIKDYILGE